MGLEVKYSKKVIFKLLGDQDNERKHKISKHVQFSSQLKIEMKCRVLWKEI